MTAMARDCCIGASEQKPKTSGKIAQTAARAVIRIGLASGCRALMLRQLSVGYCAGKQPQDRQTS
jgi:hypothetical protein